MNIGYAIQQLREAAGYTQKELAEKTNYTQTYICQIEKNKKYPTQECLQGISAVLGITLDELIISSIDFNNITKSIKIDLIASLIKQVL